MADINSQAKDLTEQLKKGTGAARGLASELAGVNNALGVSVKHAAELAEAMAKVAKASQAVAVGIGTAVAVITTVVALFVGWEEKSKEIANEITNINSETERYYAQYPAIDVTPRARRPDKTHIKQTGPKQWEARQKIVDPEGHDDWALECFVDLREPRPEELPILELRRIGI